MSKLSTENKKEIHSLRTSGKTYKYLSEKFNVSIPAIYHVINPSKRKATSSRMVAKSINKSRKIVLELLGGKCKKCGFSDIRALQLDHINGGGNKEYKKLGNYAVYRRIIKNFSFEKLHYQILCANCNWIKRYENKEIRNGNFHFSY